MAKVNRLVTNGCSYMKYHALGGGHTDLAARLGIAESMSLAESGVSNSAIIRTTVADSMTAPPTLYVVSTSFLTRFELPIIASAISSEKWCALGNSVPLKLRQYDECVVELEKYVDLHLRYSINSVKEHLYMLFLQLAMMIDSVKSRGHEIVVFNTAEPLVSVISELPQRDISFLKDYVNEIIDRLQWQSVPWQHAHGVKDDQSDAMNNVPEAVRHPAAGEHKMLNDYLETYINGKLNV